MSQPPEYPGQKRLQRMANRSGGAAYEGAFEAVGAILISTLLGYWFDQHYETEPTGTLVGAGIGFAAFVLRLVRLGRTLHGEAEADAAASAAAAPTTEQTGSSDAGDDPRGPGEGAGLSGVLDDEDDR